MSFVLRISLIDSVKRLCHSILLIPQLIHISSSNIVVIEESVNLQKRRPVIAASVNLLSRRMADGSKNTLGYHASEYANDKAPIDLKR